MRAELINQLMKPELITSEWITQQFQLMKRKIVAEIAELN